MMTTYEWLTLVGIIIGPIAAVIITLVVDERRRSRDTKMQLARMLLSSRHLPADPAYSTSINLIPVEFGHNSKVMKAWLEYIEAVRFEPPEPHRQQQESIVVAKQTHMIFRIMQSLGYTLSEADIGTSAYTSKGFFARDNLYLDSLVATREIANILRESSDSPRKR